MRQESSIQEMRLRIQDGDAQLDALRSKVKAQKGLIEDLQESASKMDSDKTSLEDRCSGLLKENTHLSRSIQDYNQKIQHESIQRKQLVQLRVQKLQRRREEIDGLNQLIDWVP